MRSNLIHQSPRHALQNLEEERRAIGLRGVLQPNAGLATPLRGAPQEIKPSTASHPFGRRTPPAATRARALTNPNIQARNARTIGPTPSREKWQVLQGFRIGAIAERVRARRFLTRARNASENPTTCFSAPRHARGALVLFVFSAPSERPPVRHQAAPRRAVNTEQDEGERTPQGSWTV